MLGTVLRRGLGGSLAAAALVALLVGPSASGRGAGAAGAAGASGAAGATATLSGKLTGLPVEKGISVSVEAVSLDDGSVGAAEVVRGSAYSLKVAPGPYLVLGSALDPQHHRTQTAYKAVQAGGASGRADLALPMRKLSSAASPSAPVVAIGNIVINGPDGVLPGAAQGGLINGLLPVCHAAGSKVMDRSAAVDDAIAQERKLAQQGQLDVKFQFNPLTPDYQISGEIGVGPGGGPLADLTVTDTKTGKVVQHIKAGGDPADWFDISHWETLIGAGTGKKLTNQSDCGVPSKEPTPTTTSAATTTSTTAAAPTSSCEPGKGSVCVVYDGTLVGSTSSPKLVAVAATTNISWHLEWTSNPAGYGVPNTLAPSSSAKGTVTVKYYSGKTCSSPVTLLTTNPPTLAQGFPASKTDVTIEIPNPAEVSTGGGSGYPSIGPTNGCPGLVGSMPANFTFKDVPLRPGTYVMPSAMTNVKDGTLTGPGKTGHYTLTGTITVFVG